ncbi:MAG: hypothetical protein NZ874_02015 [Fimbriimonadales bacterium]|nr:hypothetical protein [Fimbriimonadales bacterium]
MTQETNPQEQVFECGLPRAVNCIAATPRSLWVGTNAGLYLYRDLRAPTARFIPTESITTITAATSTIYFATPRSWGMYQMPVSLRVEPIEPPEVTHAGYVRVHALAVWNNTLAVATSFGLYSYSLSRRRWEGRHAEESFSHLLATGTRLWAFGAQLVGFDRQYQVVARAPVQVATPPVLEQSRLLWATASHAGIELCTYSPGAHGVQRRMFRFDEAALRVGSGMQPTGIARLGAFWYVGLAARRGARGGRGMVVRVNFARNRAELAWEGTPVNALVAWRGALMAGTEAGLYALTPRANPQDT